VEVVGCRNIGRFHSCLVRARTTTNRAAFVLSLGALPESNARLTPLLVSEWDHRLALLELFKMMHKGIFFDACLFHRCSAAFSIALRRDVAPQHS